MRSDYFVARMGLSSLNVTIAIIALACGDPSSDPSDLPLQTDAQCPLPSAGDVDDGTGCSQVLDVAVVGAGVAGGYAAYRLRHAGKVVGLFEYSNRVGGRAFNQRLNTAPDVVLQMGAMRFIKGTHVIMDRIVKELGLKEFPFTEGTGRVGRTRYFLRGKRLSKEEVLYGEVPYDLSEKEKKNQHRLMEFYFESLTNQTMKSASLGDFMRLKVADGRYLYQLTFNEAISLVASREGGEFVRDKSGFQSAIEKDANAVIEFQYLFENEGEGLYTVDGGMAAIVERLVQDFVDSSDSHFLKKNLQLNSLRKMRENMYVLNFQPTVSKNGRTKVLGYRLAEKVCARQVILAVPVFSLRHVDWPELRHYRVQEAYSSVLTPSVSKIFMTFSRPWWRDFYKDAFTIYGDRTSAFRMTYDWARSNQTGDYVMIASYADGNISTYLQHLQSIGRRIRGSARGAHRVTSRVKDRVLTDLALALNVDRRRVPEPTGCVAQFWADYPFGCGWVAQRAGRHFEDVMSLMRRPSFTDDVFVVGSDFAGGIMVFWMEGALQTVDSVIDQYFTETG